MIDTYHICLFVTKKVLPNKNDTLVIDPQVVETLRHRSIFTHLKLCLATATHNFKWVKILRWPSSVSLPRPTTSSGWKFYAGPAVSCYRDPQLQVGENSTLA